MPIRRLGTLGDLNKLKCDLLWITESAERPELSGGSEGALMEAKALYT